MRKDTQIKKCAEWLAECVRLGWPKAALDDLETLWWEHHGSDNAPERDAETQTVG